MQRNRIHFARGPQLTQDICVVRVKRKLLFKRRVQRPRQTAKAVDQSGRDGGCISPGNWFEELRQDGYLP